MLPGSPGHAQASSHLRSEGHPGEKPHLHPESAQARSCTAATDTGWTLTVKYRRGGRNRQCHARGISDSLSGQACKPPAGQRSCTTRAPTWAPRRLPVGLGRKGPPTCLSQDLHPQGADGTLQNPSNRLSPARWQENNGQKETCRGLDRPSHPRHEQGFLPCLPYAQPVAEISQAPFHQLLAATRPGVEAQVPEDHVRGPGGLQVRRDLRGPSPDTGPCVGSQPLRCSARATHPAPSPCPLPTGRLSGPPLSAGPQEAQPVSDPSAKSTLTKAGSPPATSLPAGV